MKNLMKFSCNHCVAIHLGSLSSSLHFQDFVDEVFSSLEFFIALHLCMVEGGPFKGL
jgi:hypothetical protein